MIATNAIWACCLSLMLAQYQRVVESGKGETRDVAMSHPLSYWTNDPLARDDGGDLCLGCKLAGGRTVVAADFKAKTDMHRLGVLGGHEIVEVLYTVRSRVKADEEPSFWKILLVGTRPEEFAEIYHLQPSGGSRPLEPARIVAVGGERILATYDSDGGNGGGCWEGYWWVDKRGPHPVDFDPVYKDIAARTPKDSSFTTGCWTLDLDHAAIKTNVRKVSAECHACGQLGMATADFEIHHGIAIPTDVQFAADPQE